jgi:hypothetical protein
MKWLCCINQWLAFRLAGALATMVCFYVVLFVVLLPLLWQRPENPILWIIFLSSTVFQAAALPILAVVAKQQGDKSERLLQETHDVVMAELKELKAIKWMEKVEIGELQRFSIFENIEDLEFQELLVHFQKIRNRSKCRQRNNQSHKR